jgi:subtilisin
MTGRPASATPRPWRGEGTLHRPGMPAWAAPRGGPPAVPAPRWLAETPAHWAFAGADGSGTRVCVLDTGIDASHPLVGGVAASMQVELDASGRPQVVPAEAADSAGHGTACAGIIRSLAPKCSITSVRVLTSGTHGGGPVLLAGLRWAIDEGYDVINLSLSTSKPALRSELAELCDAAYFRRTIICASAHNAPVTSYPWRFAAVTSVASADRQASEDGPAPRHFYNLTPPVEFFAPGVNVRVAWRAGSEITATGNSFATPYIAGLCALILSKHPDLTPFELKTLLYITSANVGGRNVG